MNEKCLTCGAPGVVGYGDGWYCAQHDPAVGAPKVFGLRGNLDLFVDGLTFGADDDQRIAVAAMERIILHFDDRLRELENRDRA